MLFKINMLPFITSSLSFVLLTSRFNAVNRVKGCLKGVYYPELRLFNMIKATLKPHHYTEKHNNNRLKIRQRYAIKSRQSGNRLPYYYTAAQMIVKVAFSF